VPNASDINVAAGEVLANLVAVQLETSGSNVGDVELYNGAGDIDAILDIEGCSSKGASPLPDPPVAAHRQRTNTISTPRAHEALPQCRFSGNAGPPSAIERIALMTRVTAGCSRRPAANSASTRPGRKQSLRKSAEDPDQTEGLHRFLVFDREPTNADTEQTAIPNASARSTIPIAPTTPFWKRKPTA